jgi:hypothetical protein
MPDEHFMSREAFLSMAEAAGLDVADAGYMDALYSYLDGRLPDMRAIRDLNMADAEPAMVFILNKE